MCTILWTAFGADDDLMLSDLPEAVRATVEVEAAGARIEDVDLERRPDGTTWYEVEFEKVGVEWEIRIDPEGVVTQRKRDDD